MRPSPARSDAPEPTAWLPVPDLDELPPLDALLAPENLVDSGQTIAINDAIQALLEPTVDPEGGAGIAAAYEARRTASARVRSIRVQSSLGARRAQRIARRRRRIAIAAIIGATAVAMVLGLVAIVQSGNRMVRLDVDGSLAAFSTRSVTVGELLRERGIVLGSDDVVTPAMNASLTSSTRVEVRRARDAQIDLNGEVKKVRTTARSLAELRTEQRISENFVATQATEVFDLSKPITFRTPRSVTIDVDGSTTKMDTTALTVRELIPMAGIVLGAKDEVTPALDALLTPGTTITVVRLADDQRTELRPIPFTTQERADASLPAGQRKVVQAGQAGSQRLTYRQVMRNGQMVSEQLISTVTVQAPRTRIIAVGRGGSGGPPAAAHGGSQGSETGQGTWYAYTPGTCAHKTLPKGTVVTVVNLANGASTTCVVADRGPYGDGRIIDMTPSVFGKLAPLSSGVIDVRIEW